MRTGWQALVYPGGTFISATLMRAAHWRTFSVQWAEESSQSSSTGTDLSGWSPKLYSRNWTNRSEFHQAVLYWTEFLLLVEFTEVIIPLVYSAYLIVAFQLPNRVFYARLRDIAAEKLKNICNVLLSALLEFVSLVAMALLLCYKLRISAVRQLTFVLESQWQQVQSKLVIWVSFTLHSALGHFGVDFSFAFAWL